MCEVPSWIVDDKGRLLFVTDKDVENWCQEHGIEVDWHNWTGHTGISKIYPNAVQKNQNEGFPCPPEILSALLDGRMRQICVHADNIYKWTREMAPVLETLAGPAALRGFA